MIETAFFFVLRHKSTSTHKHAEVTQ